MKRVREIVDTETQTESEEYRQEMPDERMTAMVMGREESPDEGNEET